MGRGRQSVPGLGAYFLSWAAVLRHMADSRQAAILGSPAGRPGILTSDSDRDVVAGVGGAVGPAPDVRHQPEGTTLHRLQS